MFTFIIFSSFNKFLTFTFNGFSFVLFVQIPVQVFEKSFKPGFLKYSKIFSEKKANTKQFNILLLKETVESVNPNLTSFFFTFSPSS